MVGSVSGALIVCVSSTVVCGGVVVVVRVVRVSGERSRMPKA